MKNITACNQFKDIPGIVAVYEEHNSLKSIKIDTRDRCTGELVIENAMPLFLPRPSPE